MDKGFIRAILSNELTCLQFVEYISYLSGMFKSMSDESMSKNLCHGILLQISSLLNAIPVGTSLDACAKMELAKVFQENIMWIIESKNMPTPCYLILDEYMKVVNLMLWKLPLTLSEQLVNKIEVFIQSLLFNSNKSLINSGKDICLANGVYLGYIIMTKANKLNSLKEFLYNCLKHHSYEVNLAAMNYLLILQSSQEPDHCNFQKHLKTIQNVTILNEISDKEEYIELLSNIFKNNTYFECKRKSLKLLTLQKNTQKYIVAIKSKVENEITDETITEVLLRCVENEHETLTHVYLLSLTDFVSEKLQENRLSDILFLEVIRVMFGCSSSENNDEIRSVVVDFMERNFILLWNYEFAELNEVEKFECKATLVSTLITTIEDDDVSLRERTSRIISKLTNKTDEIICSKAAADLRQYLANHLEKDEYIAMFTMIALLDFKSEVCLTDEINDECRVFDQSERYNIYLEETIWTNTCADIIIDLHRKNKLKSSTISLENADNKYKQVVENLCGNNFILFAKLMSGIDVPKSDALNPKVHLLVSKLNFNSR